MIINGIEFDFSTLNANDVDRMLAAQTRQQERARTEGSRYTPESDYPAWLRFQCRIFMDYLDEVLGEGASEKLGLDGSNFNACPDGQQGLCRGHGRRKGQCQRADPPPLRIGRRFRQHGPSLPPMNREQRRAAVKAHPAVVDFRAQEAAKAARRAQLKAELEALDNA